MAALSALLVTFVIVLSGSNMKNRLVISDFIFKTGKLMGSSGFLLIFNIAARIFDTSCDVSTIESKKSNRALPSRE